jgi:hypothetical protein
VKSFLKKSALCSASCLQALSITGLAVGALAISAPAAAQDYTAGAVTGTVVDQTGKAVPGATVTLSDPSTGISRTSTTTSSGGFRFAAVPIGTYTVQVSSANTPNFTATDVHVLAGQTAGLNIALPEGGNEIVVTAASIQQPFTGTTSGVTVDLEDLVTKVPVGRGERLLRERPQHHELRQLPRFGPGAVRVLSQRRSQVGRLPGRIRPRHRRYRQRRDQVRQQRIHGRRPPELGARLGPFGRQKPPVLR